MVEPIARATWESDNHDCVDASTAQPGRNERIKETSITTSSPDGARPGLTSRLHDSRRRRRSAWVDWAGVRTISIILVVDGVGSGESI